MQGIIVSATAQYSGKSGVCIALIGALEERGANVGYFKPYGTMPVASAGGTSDQDALYVNRLLAQPADESVVCPVVRSRAFIEDLLAGRVGALAGVATEAYAKVSEGRDVMVIEGPSDLAQGRAAGLSLCQLPDMLDASVLLVEKSAGLAVPEGPLHAKDCLGDRLAGLVFNWVRESDESALRDHTIPFLERSGMRVFGTIAHDPMLSSVTVAEIVEALGGAILCAENRMDLPVESFMVGAMGQEKALRFFRRKARKAVITGGDRADVQLAALETSTNLVLLTGNLPPSSLVLARADELGTPMVMLDMDTLTAVERMESLMGHVRLHGPGKADRIREMFAEGVDVGTLLAAFGL